MGESAASEFSLYTPELPEIRWWQAGTVKWVENMQHRSLMKTVPFLLRSEQNNR
jgi:hypothetical protein